MEKGKKVSGPIPQHKRLAMGQDVIKQGAEKSRKSSDKKSGKK